MPRAERLEFALRNALALDPQLLTAHAPAGSATSDAFDLAVAAVEHYLAGDFATTARLAAAALAHAHDPDAVALARAAAGLALAGWPTAAADPALHDPATGEDPLSAAAAALAPAISEPRSATSPELSPELRPVLLHFLAEASLACARVDLAARFMTSAGPVPDVLFGTPHPYLTVMRVLAVRVSAFQGHIAEAQALAASAEHDHHPLHEAADSVATLYVRAVSAFVHGNADERRGARALAASISASGMPPSTALSRGCYLLAAYGVIAVGEVDHAARLVLAAGSGPALDRLNIIDRALGLELLIVAAIAAHDADAADAWLAQLRVLDGHPVAASTVDRAASRVALVGGEPSLAVELAERSIAVAHAEGRSIEAAEGEIVLARARIALARSGDAARTLERVVYSAAEQGHLAVRRSAARELREIGRRLPPAASSGLDGLSPREREVALLVAAGHSNARIASELFLSPHTVRIHVSRVLHAFGVATRTGVAAALGLADRSENTTLDSPPRLATGSTAERATASEPPPPLTPRQRQIADLVATGASNHAIATSLGIGIKTVEKHVSDILHRWRVPSRVGITRIALATRGRAVEESMHEPSSHR